MPNSSNMFNVKKSHDTNESDKQVLKIKSIDVNTSEITINHYPLIPAIAHFADKIDSKFETLSAAARQYNIGRTSESDSFKITLSDTEVKALVDVFNKLSKDPRIPNHVKSKFVEAIDIFEAHSPSKTPRLK